MLMNFGPINKSGGERRLNVAFSRAKHHMAVISSIQFADITNDYNDGANCLKNYLRYYDQSDLLERDLMRPKLLREFGWKVAFVLAKDWHDDRAAVLERLDRLLSGDEKPVDADEEEDELTDD